MDYYGPMFCEPWRYEVGSERDYKWIPLDNHTDQERARIIKCFTDVNATIWSSPSADDHPNCAGEIIGFTALRPRDEAERKAKRIVDCVNAMAAIDNPCAFINSVYEMVDLLSQGEFPEELIHRIKCTLDNQGRT